MNSHVKLPVTKVRAVEMASAAPVGSSVTTTRTAMISRGGRTAMIVRSSVGRCRPRNRGTLTVPLAPSAAVSGTPGLIVVPFTGSVSRCMVMWISLPELAGDRPDDAGTDGVEQQLAALCGGACRRREAPGAGGPGGVLGENVVGGQFSGGMGGGP
jgi:hypothetical protein